MQEILMTLIFPIKEKQIMKRVILAAVVSAAFSAPTFAGNFGVGNGDTITHNGDNVTQNVPVSSSSSVSDSAAFGGNATANPVSIGQASADSHNNTNNIAQGSATANPNAVANGGQGGFASGQGGNANAAGTQVVNVSDNQVKQYRPVPAPAPVYVAVPNGSCKTGFGASVTGGGFGVSAGGAVMDESCNARYDAAALESLGLHDAAIARLAQSPEVARALDDAYGTRYSTKPEAQPVNSNNWQGVQ
jgi:hypothetical protein